MAIRRLAAALLAGTLLATGAGADPAGSAEPRLEAFDYGHPLRIFPLQSQGQALEMAYIDAAPTVAANGRTAVLLHGKNFCAGTWEATIAALAGAGYRVIAPDQIGFCKASKPARYQFSFNQLAANTRALLDHLGVEQAVLVGHSTGGMLATRFALMYPEATGQLVLVNPIGLEDWQALGVPWRSVDDWYQRELQTTAEGIRTYERDTYYAGQWRPAYDRWVDMLASLYAGEGRARMAWNSALAYDMIFTQPVLHEFPRLRVPTLLLIGTRDNTAIGKDLAPPALQASLGNYPELGRRAAAAIPGAVLVEFDDLGHAPQIQAPARFHRALLKGLAPGPGGARE